MAAKKRNYEMELLSLGPQMGWYGGRTVPMLLEAVPGCGKTRAVEILGAALAAHLKKEGISKTFYTATFVLPQTMPESLEGIPSPNMDLMALERLPLKDIRLLVEAKYGIWFGDEATSCPQQTGAATMTLIQDGRAGDTTLPHEVGRVIACNPPDCAAAGRDFSPPEINRVCKIKWKLPMSDFLDYMRGGPGLGAHVRYLSPTWEEDHRANANVIVASFLEKHHKLINTMESGGTTAANASEPWASQRQWENVSRLLAAIFSLGEEPSSQLCYLALEGCLGEGTAKAFMAYLREFDLPEPGDIVKAAMKEGATPQSIAASIPQHVWARPDKLRLCLESVAVYVQQAPDAKRPDYWTAAFKVIEPVLDVKPDNAMSAAKLLTDRKPAGVQVPAVALKLFKAREKAGMSRGSRKKKVK
jgi:hypothetical protein